ncbi:MAG: GSCFA domain-containing protein [Alistipes finegoldii]
MILTVSPVRHLGDSLAGNAVSKAALRLAAEELAERFPDVHYFPAYEILNDDLRDYRFYADDLVHPSPQAVEYVWEKFSATVSRSRPGVCCPTSAISSWPRRTGPATRRAQPTASSPPQARRDRGAAADRFSDRSGIFPPMYRNKFVNLRSIIRTP